MRQCLLLLFSACAMISACSGQHTKANEGWITAGHLQVWFKDYDEHKTDPIVFLHAGFQDARMWDRQVAFFCKTHRVITFDLPGQGRTTGSDTTTLIADVIKKLLDDRDVSRASLVGLSMGSVSALDFVLTYPDYVNRAVLVSPGMLGWKDVISADSLSMRLFLGMDSAFASPDKVFTATRFTGLWCVGPFRNRDSVNKEVRDYVYHTTLDCMQHHDIKDLPHFDPRGAAKRLGEIKKNVLVVYADADVPLIGSIARYMHQTIPHSRIAMVHGVAHMINMERPEEFNGLLDGFFK